MICSKCDIDKDLRYFELRKDTSQYRTQCRSCSKGYKNLIRDINHLSDTLLERGLKKCSKCSEVKEVREYNKDKHTRTGYTSLCKLCIKEKSKKDKFLNKKSRLKNLYNTTPEVVNLMLGEQNGSCAICKEDITEKNHIDHCHTTGKLRGILCRNCNIGLGHFKDNIDYLGSAINYLRKHAKL